MNMDKKYVWYACYGSNLLKERFMSYIKGGVSKLNGKSYQGCTDKSEPIDDKPINIPYELYFGNTSSAWENGGVAFLKPEENEEANTLGRMYLITDEQFLEVQKQEGSWYQKSINLGSYNGAEIKTFTHSAEYPRNAPGKKYLTVIENGLNETYTELKKEEIDNYLDECLNR
jgi:hypothetical protein